MRDVLILITVEWHDAIMLSWFVFIFFLFYRILYRGLRRFPKGSEEILDQPESLTKWMGSYGAFILFCCQGGMDFALKGASHLLAAFPDSAAIGMAWICLNTAYLLMLVCCCSLFWACTPNGLWLARFSLLSLPFPNLVLPFFCYRLGAARSGGVFTWDEFRRMDSTWLFQPIAAVALVLLLYLCCSPKLKRFWAELKIRHAETRR